MERLPYWLIGGTEMCEACLGRFIREMECRCAACDGAFCVHCVLLVHESREWLCSPCHASEAAR
jgi:hypothetical protein